MSEIGRKMKEMANQKNAQLSQYMAPNGEYYEQNDIDYLLNQGYSLNDALDELARSDRYGESHSSSAQKVSGQSGSKKNSSKDYYE